MIEVNVDNLSADPRSRHYVLPRPCPLGVPIVVKVHTYYGLHPAYSVWDSKEGDWWKNKADRRRAWSTPGNAQAAIDKEVE